MSKVAIVVAYNDEDDGGGGGVGVSVWDARVTL